MKAENTVSVLSLMNSATGNVIKTETYIHYGHAVEFNAMVLCDD